MAETAESIRKKLTAGQLIDEFSTLITGGDLAGGMRKLKSQVADNPLPVVLVGAGLAWLAFGKSPDFSSAQEARSGPDSTMKSGLAGIAGSAAAGAADAARSSAQSVLEAGVDAADHLSTTADRLRHSMLTGSSHISHRAGSSANGLVEQEPLVLAALGLGLGAAIGAVLPVSEFERTELAPTADRLRKGAEAAVGQGLESAGIVASKSNEALKEEADRQGLVAGKGKTMGERVGEVVKTAADTAEDTVREELGVAGDSNAGDTQA